MTSLYLLWFSQYMKYLKSKEQNCYNVSIIHNTYFLYLFVFRLIYFNDSYNGVNHSLIYVYSTLRWHFCLHITEPDFDTMSWIQGPTNLHASELYSKFFREADTDSDGFITFEDLKRACSRNKFSISEPHLWVSNMFYLFCHTFHILPFTIILFSAEKTP